MGTVSEKPKLIRDSSFFSINQSKIPDLNIFNFDFQNMKTKVKLDFKIGNVETNHRYQIKAKLLENKYSDFFTTETVNSHNNVIIFNSCYICDYFFEKRQNLHIILFKDSKEEGNIQLPLGQIIGSHGSNYKVQIGRVSYITISAEGINDSKSYVEIKFKSQQISFIDFSKPSNKISYLITSNERKIYESESISSSGIFKSITIPTSLIEKGFTISFLDSRQKTIAYKNESIQSFIQPNNGIYIGLNVNGKGLNIINESKITRKVSFIEYIKNGVTIQLNIGIDFTSSNKNPNDPSSLHFLGGNENDYEQAIRACGIIVAYYDYNQSFPVYGFGAVIKGQNKPNMCFNINFKQNPEIYTIDNVIKEYRNCFQKIILAGPTKFCPIIRTVIEKIKIENNPLKYHILLILTDGIILDMQDTIDALVEGSILPLSVIIIGIGNDHFQEMKVLDGDDVPLVSSKGIKRMRDLVQFVPFNKYRYNPNILAEQVFEEIPRQIIEYYTMNNIYPENLSLTKINTQNIFQNNINRNNYQQKLNNNYERSHSFIKSRNIINKNYK